MNYFFIIFILVAAVVGIILASAGFAGTFALWFGIFIVSLMDGFSTISIWWNLVFFILAIIAEVLEYFSSIYSAKKYGASKYGIFGSIIGGILGAVVLSAIIIGVGTIVGVLLGTFIGAFVGEYISGKGFITSGRAGFGAFLGRVAAIVIKVFIILLITGISVIKYISI